MRCKICGDYFQSENELQTICGEHTRAETPSPHVAGLTADQLCTTPLIEDLVPTNEEWEACEVVKDRYELMKRRVRLAFARAAHHGGPEQ